MPTTNRTIILALFQKLLPPGRPFKDSDLLHFYAIIQQIPEKTTAIKTYETMYHNNKTGLLFFFAPLDVRKNSDTFFQLYALLKPLDLTFFLRFIVPNLVCEAEETARLLHRCSPNSLIKVYHICIVKATFFSLCSSGEKHANENIFSNCKKFNTPNITLSDDLLLPLYKSINYSTLHFDGYQIQNEAASAVSIWDKLHESRQNQLDYGAQFYEEKSADINQLIAKNQEVRDLYPDSALPIEDLRRSFFDAIKLLSKVRPLDFLAAATVQKNHNDISVENGILYREFTSELNPLDPNTHVFIVSPSPFFLMKWLVDDSLTQVKATLLYSNPAEYTLVKTNIDRLKRTTIDVQFFDDWLERFSKKSPVTYTNTLVFSRNIHPSQEQDLWKTIMDSFPRPYHILEIFSSNQLQQTGGFHRKHWANDDISVPELMILPQGILLGTTPSRKFIARIRIQSTSSGDLKTDQVTLKSYQLSREYSRQLLKNYPKNNMVVTKEEMLSGKSIRQLYHETLRLQLSSGNERNMPQFIEFTPELFIWYTTSFKGELKHPKVEAYFCLRPDETKARRKLLNRGKRLDDTVKRTSKIPLEDVETWLEHVYPFEKVYGRNRGSSDEISTKPQKNVQNEFISRCKDTFLGQPISLKLLWYLHPDLSDYFSEDDYEIFTQLACSDLGFLNIGQATEADFTQYIYYTQENTRPSTQRLQLMILSQALEFATTFGYCRSNVLQNLAMEKNGDGRDALSEIRGALAKRSFTPVEMKKIYDVIVNKLDQEEEFQYLGLLIRLMTGLESNIVCALCWDDLQLVEGYDFHEFVIWRQLENGGGVYKGFNKEYSYRRIPCPLLLYKHLEKQWNNVCLATADLSLATRKKLPIVTTKTALENKVLQRSVYRPIDLEKISRTVVRAVNIPPRVILVPDQEKGTVETNLSHYSGDIFRSNFRSHGLQAARLEVGELAYLIGNKPQTTFESHYFDYMNDGEQFIIWTKLSAWCNELAQPNQHTPTARGMTTSSVNKTYHHNGTFAAGVQATLMVKHSDVIDVVLRSKHGLDCTIINTNQRPTAEGGGEK